MPGVSGRSASSSHHLENEVLCANEANDEYDPTQDQYMADVSAVNNIVGIPLPAIDEDDGIKSQKKIVRFQAFNEDSAIGDVEDISNLNA